MCVIVNLIRCTRTVTDEGHSVRAEPTNALVSQSIISSIIVSHVGPSVLMVFPLSGAVGGNAKWGERSVPFSVLLVSLAKTRDEDQQWYETHRLTSSGTSSRSIRRLYVCMGLLSRSRWLLASPAVSPFVPSALNGASAEKTSLHTEERLAMRERKAKPDLALGGPRCTETDDYKRENTVHGIIHSPPPRERVASPQLVQSRLRRTARWSSLSVERTERTRARERARQRERRRCVYTAG